MPQFIKKHIFFNIDLKELFKQTQSQKNQMTGFLDIVIYIWLSFSEHYYPSVSSAILKDIEQKQA